MIRPGIASALPEPLHDRQQATTSSRLGPVRKTLLASSDRRRFGRVASRQVHLDDCPATHLAVGANVSTTLTNDGVTGGQAHSGALIQSLGCEERLKRARLHLIA